MPNGPVTVTPCSSARRSTTRTQSVSPRSAKLESYCRLQLNEEHEDEDEAEVLDCAVGVELVLFNQEVKL